MFTDITGRLRNRLYVDIHLESSWPTDQPSIVSTHLRLFWKLLKNSKNNDKSVETWKICLNFVTSYDSQKQLPKTCRINSSYSNNEYEIKINQQNCTHGENQETNKNHFFLFTKLPTKCKMLLHVHYSSTTLLNCSLFDQWATQGLPKTYPCQRHHIQQLQTYPAGRRKLAAVDIHNQDWDWKKRN